MNRLIIEEEKSTTDRVYEYVVDYIKLHLYPPTVREVAKGVGLKSPASACLHLKTLFNLGLLETDAESGSNRAIRVPKMMLVMR